MHKTRSTIDSTATTPSHILSIRASGVSGVPEKKVSDTTHTHPYFRGVDRGGHTKAKFGWLLLVSVRIIGKF